jgi:hypothetical protein
LDASTLRRRGGIFTAINSQPGATAMRENMWKKAGFVAAILVAAGMMIGINPLSIGQDAKEKKAKGRLPAYYAEIVNDEQKAKIYDIQSKYSKKLESLNEQLLEVTKQQNTEIEDVLTADQWV